MPTLMINPERLRASLRRLFSNEWHEILGELLQNAQRADATEVLLRACMDEVADLAQAPVIFVSYADPAAVDIRVDPPRPLLGRVYVGAGFMFAGWSRSRRLVAIDTDGCARSPRQGPVTLTPRNIAQLRPGWQLVAAPPLRVWLAVVPPRHHMRNGRRRAATSAWRRRAWHAAWATIHPDRRIAARQWVATDAWQHLLCAGQTPHHRTHLRRCNAADVDAPGGVLRPPGGLVAGRTAPAGCRAGLGA